MSKMSGKEPEQPREYPQTGVANTCRSFEEYMAMFSLDLTDLGEGPVLDVAGGASSFTAQVNEMGIPAIAADPFYAGAKDAVVASARREVEVSSAKVAEMAGVYDWSYYGSPDDHCGQRAASCDRFANDFMREDSAARYVPASLPVLPFPDGTFRLALCSHFLFLYADAFGANFHRDALGELLRVVRPGGEIRIYPLVSLKWEPAAYLSELLADLEGKAEARMIPTKLPFIPTQSAVLQLVKKG